MDKVFMLIILLIVGFWGFLKYSEDSGNWIATGNNGVRLENIVAMLIV